MLFALPLSMGGGPLYGGARPSIIHKLQRFIITCCGQARQVVDLFDVPESAIRWRRGTLEGRANLAAVATTAGAMG
jgi:hypothetical protein